MAQDKLVIKRPHERARSASIGSGSLGMVKPSASGKVTPGLMEQRKAPFGRIQILDRTILR